MFFTTIILLGSISIVFSERAVFRELSSSPMRVTYLLKNYAIYLILLFLLYKFLSNDSTCEQTEPTIVGSQENHEFDDFKIKWAEALVQNITSRRFTPSIEWRDLFNTIPHLRYIDELKLAPVYLLGTRPTKRKMIMAIPAVERPKDSYLLSTLDSLIKFIDPDDRSMVSITVFLSNHEGESSNFVKKTISDIKTSHSKDIADGLLQVVLIPVLFYPPDLDKLAPTFNDSSRRMQWRTRQNLDYIYSMTYTAKLADYYLQLEDDITAALGYVKNILYFIDIKKGFPWSMMEFSSLGCIGKLYRTTDLYIPINAISIFFRRKPVDWILDDLYRTMYCNPEWNYKRCRDEVSKYRLNYEPVQFQHMGKYSSLPGKIQRLKEKNFGLQNLKKKRNNPQAVVDTSMQELDTSHSLENAYRYSAYFQSRLPPKEGDQISFAFEPPVRLKSILFTTGHTIHPEYILTEESKVYSTDDSQQVQEIGQFSAEGRFYRKLPGTLVKKIRVEIYKNRNDSLILEQIAFTL